MFHNILTGEFTAVEFIGNRLNCVKPLTHTLPTQIMLYVTLYFNMTMTMTQCIIDFLLVTFEQVCYDNVVSHGSCYFIGWSNIIPWKYLLNSNNSLGREYIQLRSIEGGQNFDWIDQMEKIVWQTAFSISHLPQQNLFYLTCVDHCTACHARDHVWRTSFQLNTLFIMLYFSTYD